MKTAEKVMLGFIGVLGATTLLLPDRQTVGVINAFANLWKSASNSALGRG